ncbi:hypothetical protein CRENPOLYSF2_4010001 [Crenothrix polyspora]|uniref:Uncharacterized protein n=1 Tax=Crenothrix polyspora TaxID=360316 RepID=A0A1R4HE72_9GAMM|nr:hypothetical protein [Crenothrix polyspora]SJM94507.1 hypothetical protein CRENPOLYSF2_4010001 [Crenothrix polyspora]
MLKINLATLIITLLISTIIPFNVTADGVVPVESGVVIRGVKLSGQPGSPGTPTGKTCDFSGEEVNQEDKLEGASVNCKKGGNLKEVIKQLPNRFNAYCFTNAPIKSARVLPAPVSGNRNHCDLSGITRADATKQFGGSVWNAVAK